MKNDGNEKINDKLIISEIIKFETECKEKLKILIDKSPYQIEEYMIINKSWLKKFISLNQKEDLFKDFVYLILKKISFTPRKYLYQNNSKKYEYYNNIRILPKNIIPKLLPLINVEINNNNNIEKILLIESKIILILEKENSLEILNEDYYPEYLLNFNENKDINTEKMIDIFIKEMKMQIPECMDANSIIYDYVTGSKIIITIINLKILLAQEKLNSQKIKEDNSLGMNKLWEDKYKLKIEKNFEDINLKIKADYQKVIDENNENFYKKLKNQVEEQNKIFSEDYQNSVIKLNNLDEKENEEKIIIDKKEEIIEKKILDDYFVIVEKNKKLNIMELKDKDKICSIFSPVLFCLSQISSLTKYFKENEEIIESYNYVENTLTQIFYEFIKRLKNIDEEKINLPQKGIFKEHSNLVFNFLASIINENTKIINSPGDLLSFILENLDIEQNKYFQYLSEDESKIELNKNKKYNIYNEQEMLQKFVDAHSTEQKTFIYEKFHSIIKTSRLCKRCNKCSYNYKSFPTLKIPLVKSKSIISPNQPDYEIINTLICKIVFPENLSQLLSPSYNSIKKEFCENCKNYKEIIYNNNIFATKEYLIINLDREKDPKNEMIFIYPEILDLRKQSKCIINLYELVGVISKKIDDVNNNIDNILEENSNYFSYFKMKKSEKWIFFDENYQLSELKSSEKVFDFKNVCVLIYKKIEEN